MTLFVLTETPAGYALHKCKDKKLLSRQDIAAEISTTEQAVKMFRLKKFAKFPDTTTATEELSTIVEGKVTPMLAQLLEDIKEERKVSLAVADAKLGNAINKLPGLEIKPIADKNTEVVYRAMRDCLSSLIPGLQPDDMKIASLGLSHSMSRHKLKFSPEKVDVMIIQAINLLDELDKEINTYAMRVREWYGWHFPEMAKIINDNLAYARVVLKMGMRTQAAKADLEEILPEDIGVAVKAAAEVSMGTEMTPSDLATISSLAQQVVDFTYQRQELSSYLTTRMKAIAPNLTTLVGELVGARLISHCGSIVNLAQSPASTIQILGAEKALFRALKTKHPTPKYGLIYHASLVGQASSTKNKGKIARMLAAKLALASRQDAHSDWGIRGQGLEAEPNEEDKIAKSDMDRIKIERKLRALEGKPLVAKGNAATGPNGQTQMPKFELKEAAKYNPDADGVGTGLKAFVSPSENKKIQEVNGGADSEDVAMSSRASDERTIGSDELANGTEKISGKKRKHRDTESEEASRKARKKEEKKAKKEAKGKEGEEKESKAARKAEKAAKKAARKEAKASKKSKHDG